MNKREIILEHIRIAGYEGDVKRAIGLYVENRISYEAYRKAYRTGERQAEMLKAKGE